MNTIAIFALVVSSIGQTFHIRWIFKEHVKLRKRVHHLEMAMDRPGYWWENERAITQDRFS